MNIAVQLGTIFLSSLAVAFSGAVMPGPLFTAVVSESAARGAGTGPLFISGHAILELALVLAIAFGLGPILALKPVFISTALVGGGIMLAMAVSMFVSIPKLELDLDDRGKRYGRIIVSAIILSLSNPYWTVWWVTIGLGFMQKALAIGIAGGAAFYLGHIAGDFIWYTIVSFSVSKGRRFLTNKRYRILIAACASLLTVFSLNFIRAGITGIRG